MTLNFEATNVTHWHGSSYGWAGTAAFITKGRKHMILQALWMNYTLIIDFRSTTFKMFSFCVIAKLAASRSAQLLQMLSCDSRTPISSSKPARLCWLHLQMWAGRRVPAWLTGQKLRTQSSGGLAALFMLENYQSGIPKLHLTGFINTTQQFH